mmetsp:Transcript_18396/g.46278  ORF Transcript_18396/g.46278 Transcript_18396/m.46278 type:complete len:204 (+) Transcript_18396:655-1266(+)
MCSRCTLLRSDHLLAEMEIEVDVAYHEVFRILSQEVVPMAVAAERVIPRIRREEILAAFEGVEPRAKFFIASRLEFLQGAYFSHQDNIRCALDCYEGAAAAYYAGFGGTYGYAYRLWCIVGASLRCNEKDVARQTLERIRDLRCFDTLPSQGAETSFSNLTARHAGLGWGQNRDPKVDVALRNLAISVWRMESKLTGGASKRK